MKWLSVFAGQVWSRYKNPSDLINWTSCSSKSKVEGDLVAWSQARWEAKDLFHEEVRFKIAQIFNFFLQTIELLYSKYTTLDWVSGDNSYCEYWPLRNSLLGVTCQVHLVELLLSFILSGASWLLLSCDS